MPERKKTDTSSEKPIEDQATKRLAVRRRKGVLRTDDWLDEYLGFASTER